MPSNVSVDPRYTAHTQYRQFVDFAQGAKEKAFVESKGTLVVGAKSQSDFIGNIFRSSSSKASNDEIRNRFKSAIMGMFCVTDESALPESVKEAMKLDDYGKGKPLTARRILAVQATVDKYFDDKAQTIMAEAVRQGVEDNETSQKLVRAAVRACIEDGDALDVVKANIKDILVDFTTTNGMVLCPVHAVKEKVDAITANLRALRAFAKDDAALVATGKGFVHLEAKDFNALMSAVMEGRQQLQPHLPQILQRGNGAKAMDEGIRAFSKALEETTAKFTAVVGQPAGQAEAANMRTFIVRLLLHRDGDPRAVYHELQEAMSSDAAKQLKALYRDLMADLRTTSQSPFDDVPDGLRLCMADHAERGSACLDLLKDSMYDFYEVPAGERRPVAALQGNTRALNDYRTIAETLKTTGQQAMRAERDAFVQKTVKGSGTAAERMRSVFARKIDEAALYRPADAVKSQCEETISRMLRQGISIGMNRLSTHRGQVDFVMASQNFSVSLPGGKTLSNNFQYACDQLAEFITGGKKSAFKELTPSEKNKVLVVMSFVSQETATASYKGPACALNPAYDPRRDALEEERFKPTFNFDVDMKDRGRHELKLELGDDGGLKIGFKDRKYLDRLRTLDGDKGRYVGTEVEGKADIYSYTRADMLSGRPLGSTIEVEYSFEIKADAFTRLADSAPGKVQLGSSDVVCRDFQMSMSLYDPR